MMIQAEDLAYQFHKLKSCVEADKRALSLDPDASQDDIAECAALLADLHTLCAEFIVRKDQRVTRRRNEVRRRELLPRCARLKEEMERAKLPYVKARDEVAQLQSLCHELNLGVMAFLQTEPRPETYPSDSFVRNWRAEKEKGVRELARLRKLLKEATDEQNHCSEEYQKAVQAFEVAALEEQGLRSPAKPMIVPAAVTPWIHGGHPVSAA
jgi:hypothetical protein